MGYCGDIFRPSSILLLHSVDVHHERSCQLRQERLLDRPQIDLAVAGEDVDQTGEVAVDGRRGGGLAAGEGLEKSGGNGDGSEEGAVLYGIAEDGLYLGPLATRHQR